ncbi:MAG: hypothetical protein AAFV49_07850 [Pseudomonadota bacterium]
MRWIAGVAEIRQRESWFDLPQPLIGALRVLLSPEMEIKGDEITLWWAVSWPRCGDEFSKSNSLLVLSRNEGADAAQEIDLVTVD